MSEKAYINGDVLQAARIVAGFSVEQAAKKVAVPQEKYISWEHKVAYPTVKQAYKLSRAFYTLFSALYLDEPPIEERPDFVDYRTDQRGFKHSHELIRNIRESILKRTIYCELLEEMDQSPVVVDLSIDRSEPYKHVGQKIVNYLNIDYREIRRTKKVRDAFKYWRKLVEDKGIFVFISSQYQDVSSEEMSGLSISYSNYPIILLNKSDSDTRKIFSLIHELTHIGMNTNSLCDISFRSFDLNPRDSIESFCNYVAGEVLLPSNHIPTKKMEYTYDMICELADEYKISREVVIRRLFIEKYIDKRGYKTLVYELKQKYQYEKEGKTRKSGSGFAMPHDMMLFKTGKPYVKRVLEAYSRNIINDYEMSKYLGLKLGHIKKLSQKFGAYYAE